MAEYPVKEKPTNILDIIEDQGPEPLTNYTWDEVVSRWDLATSAGEPTSPEGTDTPAGIAEFTAFQKDIEGVATKPELFPPSKRVQRQEALLRGQKRKELKTIEVGQQFDYAAEIPKGPTGGYRNIPPQEGSEEYNNLPTHLKQDADTYNVNEQNYQRALQNYQDNPDNPELRKIAAEQSEMKLTALSKDSGAFFGTEVQEKGLAGIVAKTTNDALQKMYNDSNMPDPVTLGNLQVDLNKAPGQQIIRPEDQRDKEVDFSLVGNYDPSIMLKRIEKDLNLAATMGLPENHDLVVGLKRLIVEISRPPQWTQDERLFTMAALDTEGRKAYRKLTEPKIIIDPKIEPYIETLLPLYSKPLWDRVQSSRVPNWAGNLLEGTSFLENLRDQARLDRPRDTYGLDQYNAHASISDKFKVFLNFLEVPGRETRRMLNGDPEFIRTGHAVADFIANTVTDPLMYVGPGAIPGARTALKAAGFFTFLSTKALMKAPGFLKGLKLAQLSPKGMLAGVKKLYGPGAAERFKQHIHKLVDTEEAARRRDIISPYIDKLAKSDVSDILNKKIEIPDEVSQWDLRRYYDPLLDQDKITKIEDMLTKAVNMKAGKKNAINPNDVEELIPIAFVGPNVSGTKMQVRLTSGKVRGSIDEKELRDQHWFTSWINTFRGIENKFKYEVPEVQQFARGIRLYQREYAYDTALMADRIEKSFVIDHAPSLLDAGRGIKGNRALTIAERERMMDLYQTHGKELLDKKFREVHNIPDWTEDTYKKMFAINDELNKMRVEKFGGAVLTGVDPDKYIHHAFVGEWRVLKVGKRGQVTQLDYGIQPTKQKAREIAQNHLRLNRDDHLLIRPRNVNTGTHLLDEAMLDKLNLKKSMPLKELKGISPKFKLILDKSGIKTIERLASKTPEELAKIKGISLKQARRMLTVARTSNEYASILKRTFGANMDVHPKHFRALHKFADEIYKGGQESFKGYDELVKAIKKVPGMNIASQKKKFAAALKFRSGLLGYVKDPELAMKMNSYSFFNKLHSDRTLLPLEGLLRKEAFLQRPGLRKILEDRLELVKNIYDPLDGGPTEKKWMSRWRSFQAAYQLSLPPSALVNLLGPIQLGAPELTMRSLTEGYAMLMGIHPKFTKAKTNALLRELKVGGAATWTGIDQLQASGLRSAFNASKKDIREGRLFKGAVSGLMVPFQGAEHVNRKVVPLAAYWRMRNKYGMAHEDALILARDADDAINFVYNRADLPKALVSPLGSTLFQFQTFQINALYNYSRMFKQAIIDPLGTNSFGVNNATRVIRMFGSQLVLGGVRSFPFALRTGLTDMLFLHNTTPEQVKEYYGEATRIQDDLDAQGKLDRLDDPQTDEYVLYDNTMRAAINRFFIGDPEETGVAEIVKGGILSYATKNISKMSGGRFPAIDLSRKVATVGDNLVSDNLLDWFGVAGRTLHNTQVFLADTQLGLKPSLAIRKWVANQGSVGKNWMQVVGALTDDMWVRDPSKGNEKMYKGTVAMVMGKAVGFTPVVEAIIQRNRFIKQTIVSKDRTRKSNYLINISHEFGSLEEIAALGNSSNPEDQTELQRRLDAVNEVIVTARDQGIIIETKDIEDRMGKAEMGTLGRSVRSLPLTMRQGELELRDKIMRHGDPQWTEGQEGQEREDPDWMLDQIKRFEELKARQ